MVPNAMRLLFVIKGLVVSGGGAERVFVDVVNTLAARGHDVQVATFDPPDSAFFYPLDPSIPVHSLGNSAPAQPTRASELPGIMRNLRSLVRKQDPCAVVAFMHSTFVPVGLALWGSGIPLVASEHVDQIHYRGRALQRVLRDLVFARSAAITIPSEASRLEQPPQWHERMHVIPNAIDHDALQQSAMSRQPEPVILSVGRLMAEKDFPTLIRAFAQVAPDFPEWRLRIAGDGHLRDSIEEEAAASGFSDRIELPGYVRDTASEYARASVFAIPSLYESFGLVTAEALASSLPVVGFADCLGTAQLIGHEKNGLLVDPGEDRANALAAALRTLMADPALRARLAAEGPDSVRPYSVAAVADKWEQMLTTMCQGQER